MEKIASAVISAIGSKVFTWCVLVFFAFQSLWLAFSFRYPLCYDEIFHFPVIKIFSNQLSPFIFNQPTQFDRYGDLSNGSATIFHYLMSFPLRLTTIFTSDQNIQTQVLRVICIGMVIAGLYLFYRLFRKIKINPAIINTGLLLTILLPIFIMTSATINYDNLLFLLTAWYFLICINIIKSKKVNWLDYVGLICVSLFAFMTKQAFLPVFASSFIFIAFISYKRYGGGIFVKFWRSMISEKRMILISILIVFTTLVGVIAFRYVRNVSIYQTLSPSCSRVLGLERCMKNGVFARNWNAKSTVNSRKVESIQDFVVIWYRAMYTEPVKTAGVPADLVLRIGQALPVMLTLMFFGIILAFAAILFSWNSIFNKIEWKFLFFVVLTLIVAVFYVNARTYYNLHAAYAMQPRYMLSVMPIILVATVASLNYIFRKSSIAKLSVLLCVMLIISQGGGLITHIIRSDENWNWDSQKVRQINNNARNILKPLVKER